eukprot:10908394-Lingulodinium_polyedra.AAC.1
MEDLKRTGKVMRRAKLRKYTPDWSAPAEVWRQVLFPAEVSVPTKYWNSLRAGIGTRAWEARLDEREGGVVPDPFNRFPLRHLEELERPRRCLYELLLHVRRAKELPAQAMLSQGFAPDKKNGKPGVAGRRLLHV